MARLDTGGWASLLRRAVVAATSLAVLLSAACGSRETAESRSDQASTSTVSKWRPAAADLMVIQDRLHRAAVRRLGSDRYACVIVNDIPEAEPPTIDLYLTDPTATAAARRLMLERAPDYESQVKITSPRFSNRRMTAITQTIGMSMPEEPDPGVGTGEPMSIEGEPDNALVQRGDPSNLAHCPRVVIGIERKGFASGEIEAWAMETVDEFGSDTVVVRRFGGANVSIEG